MIRSCSFLSFILFLAIVTPYALTALAVKVLIVISNSLSTSLALLRSRLHSWKIKKWQPLAKDSGLSPFLRRGKVDTTFDCRWGTVRASTRLSILFVHVLSKTSGPRWKLIGELTRNAVGIETGRFGCKKIGHVSFNSFFMGEKARRAQSGVRQSFSSHLFSIKIIFSFCKNLFTCAQDTGATLWANDTFSCTHKIIGADGAFDLYKLGAFGHGPRERLFEWW